MTMFYELQETLTRANTTLTPFSDLERDVIYQATTILFMKILMFVAFYPVLTLFILIFVYGIL